MSTRSRSARVRFKDECLPEDGQSGSNGDIDKEETDDSSNPEHEMLEGHSRNGSHSPLDRSSSCSTGHTPTHPPLSSSRLRSMLMLMAFFVAVAALILGLILRCARMEWISGDLN